MWWKIERSVSLISDIFRGSLLTFMSACQWFIFICLLIYLWLCSSLLDLGRFFQFLNPVHGRTPWTGVQPVARPLPVRRTTQTQNKLTQTSMSWLGFEPAIPAFERPKTVHGLDRSTTVMGSGLYSSCMYPYIVRFVPCFMSNTAECILADVTVCTVPSDKGIFNMMAVWSSLRSTHVLRMLVQ
jgi:hypothetical protein